MKQKCIEIQAKKRNKTIDEIIKEIESNSNKVRIQHRITSSSNINTNDEDHVPIRGAKRRNTEFALNVIANEYFENEVIHTGLQGNLTLWDQSKSFIIISLSQK